MQSATTVNLDAVQILILTALSIVVTQILKIWSMKRGKKLTREMVSVACMLTSLILSIFLLLPSLVALKGYTGDIGVIIQSISVQISAVMGLATFLYNVLIGKFFDKVGFSTDEIDQLTGGS